MGSSVCQSDQIVLGRKRSSALGGALLERRGLEAILELRLADKKPCTGDRGAGSRNKCGKVMEDELRHRALLTNFHVTAE